MIFSLIPYDDGLYGGHVTFMSKSHSLLCTIPFSISFHFRLSNTKYHLIEVEETSEVEGGDYALTDSGCFEIYILMIS